MYDLTSIQALIDLIGWAQPIPPSDITLSPSNGEGVSGRFFNDFHSLVIVENVFLCLENSLVGNDDLNSQLYQMKKASVMEVLSKIFDTNVLANYAETEGVRSINFKSDYSDVIISQKNLFAEAIGYSMATRCIKLFLTTNRSNATETSIGMKYDMMTFEVAGIKDQFGRQIAKGTKDEMEAAITNAIIVLFPTEKSGQKRIIDRSYLH